MNQKKVNALNDFLPKSAAWIGLGLLLLMGPTPKSAAAAPKRPNVVIIVADDLGWNDIGFHNKEVKTPHLDKLAADGIRLERYYSYPICSMTRAALMTGLSTSRTGVGNQRGLRLDAHLLPQTFRAAGYQTWMFGKWHLGGPSDNAFSGEKYYPHNRGFDYFYGFLHGATDYTRHVRPDTGAPDWQRNGQQVKEEGYSTDLLADDAVKMLKGRDKAKPVLLYLAFNAVHTPFGVPPSGINLYRGMTNRKRQNLLANVTHMDTAVGRVLKTIDEEGLRDNSMILFVSDNGGELQAGASNAPLRGEKGTTFEGGMRVPGAVRWPGVLKAGSESRLVISAIDLFPTLAAAAGVKPGNSTPFDGRNLWPEIRDGKNLPPENLVLTHGQNVAVFHGPWKLVRSSAVRDKMATAEPMLFRIDDDPEEKSDLAAKHPDVVKDLLARGKAITDLSPMRR